MITIIPDLVPADHPLDRYPMTPAYITIHETANTKLGATAAMHGRYLLSAEAVQREVLWHFTVDDHEIRQHLPTDRNGWHAGDGFDGPGNRTSIGIEICVNQDGDFEKAKANAADLVAHLIETIPSLRPFPECLVQHHRWSGKNCPTHIRATPGGWERFVGAVRERLAATGPASDVPADAWYAQDVADLMGMGIVTGDPDGRVRPLDAPTRAEMFRALRQVIRYITGR